MAFSLERCQTCAVKLTQIRHFIAVAGPGSLPAGAADLGVSPHALIHSIRALERELGTALFKRGKQSMTLTPLGETFLRRVSAAQRELDRAGDAISRNPGSSTGLVAIGLSGGPLVSVLPDTLRSFQARFEHVRVRIVEGVFAKLEREIRDGSLDFYVGPVEPRHPAGNLKVDRLHDVGRIVVGRAGHPLAGATSLAQLAGARWIATSRGDLDPLFERHRQPRPVVVLEAETGFGMVSAAAASDALLILPASWAPLIDRAGLTVLPLNEMLDPLPIYMVTRTELPLTPAAAYLHDLVVHPSRDR